MSRAEYLREWRKQNPEKVKQHKRNYYSTHKEHEQEKSNKKYSDYCKKRFGFREYFCPKCLSFVFWNHSHFISKPKIVFNHHDILPEYKEEYKKEQRKLFELTQKWYIHLRKNKII